MTFASTIGDPLTSVTFPAMVPVVDWAKARLAQNDAIRQAGNKTPDFPHMIFSSMNFCCTDDPNQVRHRHHFPYRELIASHSIAPLLKWARLARWPENR